MTKPKQKIWNGNVRDAALSILLEVNNEQAYSNLLLRRTIDKYKIDEKDRGLLTELTYGTLQYRMTLDYYLEPFLHGKLNPWVRELLRLSLYQIVYLTKIPPHAVVHEAVEIAKRRGHKRIAPTVNGILRNVLRQGVRPLDEIEDSIEKISIETSHPKWLIEKWAAQFGERETIILATENNNPAALTMRVNVTKTTADEAVKMLEKEGVIVRKGENVPNSLVSLSGNPAVTEAFKKGFITIQDESSMLPAMALQVQPGMKVLDMCAAPGGKTTHIAELMQDQGHIYAHDLHAHKIALIQSNTQRLGLSSVEAKSGDSRNLIGQYEKESFDRILVDAPCSGFGVIRRKPEIKYNKTPEDIKALVTIQCQLLEQAAALIKPDGIIVYSTCTLEPAENEGMAELFLAQHKEMEKMTLSQVEELGKLTGENEMIQVLPQDLGSDGFFVAAFRKKTAGR